MNEWMNERMNEWMNVFDSLHKLSAVPTLSSELRNAVYGQRENEFYPSLCSG